MLPRACGPSRAWRGRAHALLWAGVGPLALGYGPLARSMTPTYTVLWSLDPAVPFPLERPICTKLKKLSLKCLMALVSFKMEICVWNKYRNDHVT